MKSKLDRWLPVIFILLLLYGSFIRFYGLGEKSFWIDEAISGLAASKIVEKGVPLLDSGKLYSGAFVFHYIMAFFLLFGKTEFLARLVSVFFGIGTCVLIYYFGKEYNKATGWIAFIFALFLEVFVEFSRQARMYQMEMFLFFLTLFLLYRGIKNYKYILYSIPVFLVAQDTRPLALLLIPVYFFVMFKRKLKKWIIIASIIPFGYLIFRGWYLIDDFRPFYLLIYLSYLKYYLPIALIAVIGFFVSLKKRMSWLMAYSALSILFINAFNVLFAYRYVYIAFFPLVVLTANALSKIKFKWVVIGLYILWLSNILNPLLYTFVIIPEKEILHTDKTAPTADFREIYAFVKNETGYSYLITTFSPAAAFYLRRPDYWIAFSFTGLPRRIEDGFEYYNGVGTYTGAKVIMTASDFNEVKNNSIVVVDDWAAKRINPAVFEILSNCTVIAKEDGIKAYRC